MLMWWLTDANQKTLVTYEFNLHRFLSKINLVDCLDFIAFNFSFHHLPEGYTGMGKSCLIVNRLKQKFTVRWLLATPAILQHFNLFS